MSRLMSRLYGKPTDTNSDNESLMSLPPFSPTPSTSQTSSDASMRSGSPAPSVWSVTSSLRHQAVKQMFGRSVNNYSEVYGLAADEEELHRLGVSSHCLHCCAVSVVRQVKQHEMFKEVMGGNYPPPMYEIMADDTPGETKACLDLGCGSGSW
jgi:hypothetical protein